MAERAEEIGETQLTLQTWQYRDVCRYLLQVERYCRFEKSVYSLDEIGCDLEWLSNMTISDDYVAWNVLNCGKNGAGCFLLDKESNEITLPSVLGYKNFYEMEVYFANSTESEVRVREPKNQWTVKVGDAEENGYGNNAKRQMFFWKSTVS